MKSKVPLHECQEILEKAKTIFNDEQYPNTYKTFVADVLHYAGRRGFLTKKQVDAVADTWNKYQLLINIYTKYPLSLKESVGVVLEETLKLAEPFKDPSMRALRGHLSIGLRGLQNESYFWNNLTRQALSVQNELKKRDVILGDLERMTIDLDGQIRTAMKENGWIYHIF